MAPRKPDRRVAMAAKQRKALELRKSGATFEEIARQLRYANGGGAYKAVSHALAATLQEPAEELRRLELERCDCMQMALWPKVSDGDPEAVRACLRIMVRRSALLGLDAPAKSRIEVITRDAFSAAMAELEAEVGELQAAADRSDAAGDRAGQ